MFNKYKITYINNNFANNQISYKVIEAYNIPDVLNGINSVGEWIDISKIIKIELLEVSGMN